MSLAPATRFPAAPQPFFSPDAAHQDAQRGVVHAELRLRHLGTRSARIAYECLGDATRPVVVVVGGISADRHVAASGSFPEAGWWDVQVGIDRAIDPRRRCVLAIDWLGSDGVCEGPIDPADQADAIAAVLDALGIRRVAAFVGCSYGAMVGLHFAHAHGSRLDQLVAISGCARAHPYASALRALQRRAVALGALQCDEAAGLALARELAMLSYRTPEEFAGRFDAPARVANGRVRCGAEDYLDACGSKFAGSFPAAAFLRLSESIDLHDVDAGQVDVPTTVVAVAEDRLVPIEDAYRLFEQLRGAKQLRVLRSRFGHDAFLKEHEDVARVLREALQAAAGVVA
jgi:homoserine O-acetyltransferase